MHAPIVYACLLFGKPDGQERMPDVAESERADLGAMVLRLGRRLLAMEQPILQRYELSMWAYVVLTALRSGPARAQAALAASIGADKTRLIPVLDELQGRGLIEREPDPADRRARLLGLTADGRRLQRDVQAAIREAEADLMAGLTEEDQAAFIRVLAALSQAR
jgi:DNA-binding MarR family transcriptional regulator